MLTAQQVLSEKFPTVSDKQAQLALSELAAQRLERLQKENPLRFFVPNGKIEQLINAVGNDTKKWIFILPAANSLGKSAAAINILGNIIWGSQSQWYKGERFTNWTYPKKFWYISEKDTLKNFVCGVSKDTQSEISKWFPLGRYDVQKLGYEYYSSLTTDNGWQGSFKSYDQDVKQFEADKIGVAIFDEPPPEVIFNAVVARMTLGGIILMPMTPLTHSAWTLDRLVNKASEASDVFVLYGDIEDNCKQHGIRGRLDHAQIERILSQYDPDEIEARAHGRYTHLKGVVYKSIHPSIHRHDYKPAFFTQDKYQIFNVVDPHDARPPFVAWFAVDQWKNAFAVDEFPDERFDMFHNIKHWKQTTTEVCKEIKNKEIANGWDGSKIVRVMDPNFGNKPIQAVGKTTRDWYAEVGRQLKYNLYYSTDVVDDLNAGHSIVKDWLWINPDNETRFKIGENCRNIWHQLTHYSFAERTGKSLEVHGTGEKVAERFKDGADVVRYFFMFIRAPYIVEPPKNLTRDEYVSQIAFKPHMERIQKLLNKGGKRV